MMGMTYWLPVIIPVIISVAALVISILGLLYQSYYNQADYEYKRDPEFEVSVRMALQTKEYEAEQKTYPVIDKFNVDITAKNNIESLYIVSPTFEVTKIDVKYDIEKQLSDYFSQAYQNGKPDIANDNSTYFYRFVIYSSIDDDIEMKLLYFKGSIISAKNKDMDVNIRFIDPIELLEFEKAHLDDSEYEGERQIMKQYRDLKEYYGEWLY